MIITTLKEAKEVTGGGVTNKNSKMPEFTYDLSAWECITGAKLVNVKGSTCEDCYERTFLDITDLDNVLLI